MHADPRPALVFLRLGMEQRSARQRCPEAERWVVGDASAAWVPACTRRCGMHSLPPRRAITESIRLFPALAVDIRSSPPCVPGTPSPNFQGTHARHRCHRLRSFPGHGMSPAAVHQVLVALPARDQCSGVCMGTFVSHHFLIATKSCS